MIRNSKMALWALCFTLALLSAAVFVGCGESDRGDLAAEVVRDQPPTPLALALAARAEGPPQLTVAEPVGNAVVTSPIDLRVEVENFALAPAGTTSDGEGHWHILIDQECFTPGTPIPDDNRTIHVGTGSNSATIELDPGTYELCVQVGDGFHVAVNVSDSITLTVVE